jgi:hypothetical protein
MSRVTTRDKDSLNQLVLDCSLYNFSEKDALQYIETRFGKAISGRTYRRYKSSLENGNITQEWMKYFTRTGFVLTHQQVFQGAKYLLESSMRRLSEEENRTGPKDDNFILKLKQEIREELHFVSELSLGTPILDNIISQRDNQDKKYNELVKKINMRDLCYSPVG